MGFIRDVRGLGRENLENRRLASLLALALTAPAAAEKRVALVIGNSAYQNVTRLDNPRNDAALMAETLGALGFTLIGGRAQLDLDKPAMDTGRAEFRPPGSGRRRRAVLLCRPRRAGLRRELSRSGRRQPDARGRRRFPDGRRQPRAAPDAGLGHAPQHGDPRCLPEQSVRRPRIARLRRRAGADARAGGHADLLCDAARQCRARRRRRPQPLYEGAGHRPSSRPGSTSSRLSIRSASP